MLNEHFCEYIYIYIYIYRQIFRTINCMFIAKLFDKDATSYYPNYNDIL